MTYYEIIYLITNPIFTFSIYKLFHCFFGEDISDKRLEKILYIGYTIALSIIIFITRIPIIMLLLNFLSFLFISFNYKCSFLKKIFRITIMISILMILELISIPCMNFINISPSTDNSYNSVIGVIFVRTITMFVSYLLNRYMNSKIKEITVPHIYYIFFILILISTLYLFIVSLENDNLNLINIIIRGFVLIIVNLIIIIMDEKIYSLIIETNEKNILKEQNRAYENQIEIIKQSNESIRAIKHDMKNHLITLNELIKNNNYDEYKIYMSKILEDIDGNSFSASNNFIVDSIVNFKLRQLKDTKINVNINIPSNINILAYDLTIILGNLLDNAITAIEQSEKKYISLKINCNMGNLIILLDNSYNGKIALDDGKLKTTKSLKDGHGIGLKSVENVLKNYDGDIQTEYTSDIFTTSVIIPFNT